MKTPNFNALTLIWHQINETIDPAWKFATEEGVDVYDTLIEQVNADTFVVRYISCDGSNHHQTDVTFETLAEAQNYVETTVNENQEALRGAGDNPLQKLLDLEAQSQGRDLEKERAERDDVIAAQHDRAVKASERIIAFAQEVKFPFPIHISAADPSANVDSTLWIECSDEESEFSELYRTLMELARMQNFNLNTDHWMHGTLDHLNEAKEQAKAMHAMQEALMGLKGISLDSVAVYTPSQEVVEKYRSMQERVIADRELADQEA